MDFDVAPEHEAFRAEVRQYLAERLPDDWQGIFVEGDEAWQLSVGQLSPRSTTDCGAWRGDRSTMPALRSRSRRTWRRCTGGSAMLRP
jgi:hypothetical protein